MKRTSSEQRGTKINNNMYFTETETVHEVDKQIKNAWDQKKVENIKIVPEVVFHQRKASIVVSEPQELTPPR